MRAGLKKQRDRVRFSLMAAASAAALVAVIAVFTPPAFAVQVTVQREVRADSAWALPPVITRTLESLARRRSMIVFRQRFAGFGKKRAGRLARSATKKALKEWTKTEARKCPDPLPHWFFCERPPESHWGRGVALEINRGRPGEFYSQWRPQDPPPRALNPGYVFWLTCWSEGAYINNGRFRSNLWYQLTNGLWVSDGWLDTGTNQPIEGVSHC